MCVFSAAKPPKKHTLVLFEAAGGGLKKNILFRTRYLDSLWPQAGCRVLLTGIAHFPGGWLLAFGQKITARSIALRAKKTGSHSEQMAAR